MIAITHSMDLKWPFYVDNYLNISTQFGSPGDVISLDCVLKDENVAMPSIHVKALIAVIFPFAIMTFIVIALILLNVIKKKSQKNRAFISFIVMSIFLQPTILQILFDNLNYTTINNVQYLTKNLMIRYDDEEHRRWVLIDILLNSKYFLLIRFFFSDFYRRLTISCFLGCDLPFLLHLLFVHQQRKFGFRCAQIQNGLFH